MVKKVEALNCLHGSLFGSRRSRSVSNDSTQLNALQVRDVTPASPHIVQQPTNRLAWISANVTIFLTAMAMNFFRPRPEMF